MRHALSRLHGLVVEETEPLRNAAATAAERQALEERCAADCKLCLLYLIERSIDLQGREQLHLLVQGYQRSFVHWLDLAYHYQRDYPEHPLQGLYQALTDYFFESLRLLRHYYGAYFNVAGKAANICQEQCRERLRRQWGGLLPALESKGAAGSMVAVVFCQVSAFLNGAEVETVSFARLDWLEELTHCLEGWVQADYIDAGEAFMLQLLQINFNTADFVACCVAYIRQSGQEAFTIKERLERLHRLRQQLHYLCTRKDIAYSPELPEAWRLVAAWVEDELVVVEKLSGECPSPSRGFPFITETDTIVTVFSVPQLIAWAKGHVDAGVFPEESVEGLCRKLARLFRTRHQEHISPDSLQNKAYVVSEKTKEIVNEQLIKVFNIVKRY